ncbi:MAG TPA: DUF6599 family protein [Terriglobales bacterium]|nr:DUF6599 family protein [Terriglobales bacterium]
MKQVVLSILLLSTLGYAATSTGPALLPQNFAGWEKSASQTSNDPRQADPAHPELLREFGFSDGESATYTKPGHSMKVKAARFNDASGSYGAFTFYKTPEMATEKIGDQASSSYLQVLFYRGNVLVDVSLDTVTAMTAADLRQLADSIPLPTGSARNLPTLPTYLPKQGYVRNSAKYVIGPIGFSLVGASFPAEQVDFSQGAEIALGEYTTGKGTAQLTLIAYPTPQIAAAHLKTIDAAHEGQNAEKTNSGVAFFSRRSGPILAVITGSISASEAKSLLASVNYDADITWNENTFFSKRNNVGNLLVNIIVLIAILLGMAIVVGIAFGGVRILAKRFFPDRIFDRSEAVEIIRLDIGK